MIYNKKDEYVNVDGQIVERDALRIAEAIRDYDPNLVLLCLDPSRDHALSDEPFVVAERDAQGILHPVLKAWILDNNLLERIKLADQQKVNGWEQLLDLEKKNKKASDDVYNERRGATKDLVASIVGDRKSKFTYKDERTDDMVTIYDDRPSERK